jgi:hypothetical protein
MSVADRQVAVWLALLTFVTYAYFHGGGGWNQNSQFDLTRAVVERHTFAIDAYAGNTGDVSAYHGHVYTNKAPGLSLLAVIPYMFLHAFERDPDESLVLALNHYVCILFLVAFLGACVPAMLYCTAREQSLSAPWAATVAIAVALATQSLPYSTIFMLHVPSGALMLFGLLSRRRTLGGFATGLAVAMNYLCAPALLFAFARGRLARFIAGAALPLVAVGIYQQICFGNLFTPGIAHEDARFLTKGAHWGIFTIPSLDALYGITVSPYRGLFYFAPVLIAALGGFVLWFRSGQERRALVAVAIVSAAFFLFNISFNGWEGGFGIGARYLVPLIPLWGLAMLHLRGWLRPVFIVLAVLSFVFNFAAAAVDPQPSGTIPRPLTQYIFPLLIHGHFSPAVPITPPWSAATFTGHTSVNRMTHDEAIVFSRHPPGSDASEWASFNLGEPLFGPGDGRSLIPIALVIAAGLVAIAMKTRSIPQS